MEGNPVSYVDPFGLEARKAAESRRNQLGFAGAICSSIAITGTVVIGGAIIFFSHGLLTPAAAEVIIAVAGSAGASGSATGLAVGIASEYEWAHDYEKGYVSEKEALKEIGNAAFINVLALIGGKAGAKAGSEVAEFVGNNMKYWVKEAFETIGGHLGDVKTLHGYYKQ